MHRFLVVLFLFLAFFGFGQENEIWMHENRGQWNENILQKIELIGGEMYLEKQGTTYLFHNAGEMYHAAHGDEEHAHTGEMLYKTHAIKTHFIGSNPNSVKQASNPSPFYRNYFIGSDSSKWAGKVYSHSEFTYLSFYPGIDYCFSGASNKLVYSFKLIAGANPNLIRFHVAGANKLFLDEAGNLHTEHRFGEIIESAPKAWNIDLEGKKTEINIRFKLTDSLVSFEFPDGYDANQAIYIDPELTFSSFTGSTGDNWGFSAAPDNSANVFAAGIVFGPGYPYTPGAFDATFNGSGSSASGIDIGLSKFNATGTSLLYSTYIGGAGTESPHSIICNANDELFVMGATSSVNFPIISGAYDPTHNGGPNTSANGLTFSLGSDLYVVKVSADGSSLLASTYMGGSGTDGLNVGGLQFNYGDQFRGEIILDPQGNPIVASTTQSTNFPSTNGFQTFLNGQQDAVVFKLNSNLSNLLWSSYFGGSGLESGNSMQLSSTGQLYMTGGTTSANLNLSSGNDLTYNGGLADGYVIRLSNGVPSILNGTYIGDNEYDQSYFVQLDPSDNVYVFGQTESNFPITPGLFGVANSGQFIRKFTPNLTTVLWQTAIGAGIGHVEISPTAFLVSDCYEIYFSGWGGVLNQQHGNAPNSTTNNFPITPDAFQANTNGSNFYIAVLSADAATLKYATYMGGVNSSSNHVDGGTSRFDKSGRIYHAVCAACGGNDNGFTTTPGVVAPSNPSPNCNLAAFKFELNQIEALVAEPQNVICLPSLAVFDNNSTNGNSFLWNFGDGTTSTQENPSHLYPSAGIYDVSLVVSDNAGCFSPDTAFFQVTIGDFNGQVTSPNAVICPGESFQFNASGGSVYSWSPANLLDDPTISNPTATVFQTTTFTVVISDSCGTDTLQVVLQVSGGSSQVSNDTTICIGSSVPLFASGGQTYLWSPSTGLDNPNSASPIATPSETTTYIVDILSSNGCNLKDTVKVTVVLTPPQPVIPDLVKLCKGTSTTISVSGADSYSWLPNSFINTTSGPTIVVNPTTDQWFYCDFINACDAVRDSVFIEITEATIQAKNDTTICPGQSAFLSASGGISYIWKPANTLTPNTGSQVIARPTQTTSYLAIGTDLNGCKDSATVTVSLFPNAFIQTCPDVYAFFGDIVELSASSSTPGTYVWSPTEYLSCAACVAPTAQPNQNFAYQVSYVDNNGCSASDSVHIYYNATVYVPNTFTPGTESGSLLNNVFQAVGGNVNTFELSIYNRWGERIKVLNSLSDSWDGTYKGFPCQDGTYVWKMRYTDFYGNTFKKAGHINLLR